jgi:hypothetical protein
MTNDLVERVMAAMYNDPTDVRTATKRGIAIALEEAAKACEAELVGSFDQYSLGYNDGCKENAAAIRAMMEKKDV